MTQEPQAAYEIRVEARRAELRLLDERDRRLSLARAIVAGLALVALIVTASRPITVVGLGLAAVVFVILVIVHERLARRLSRARRRVAFYEAALARARGEWIGQGEPGTEFLDPVHPNAIDLDLFGRGSLFERLCTARTHAGQEQLAIWLRHGSPVAELRERQRAVAEIGPRLDLREDLAVLGAEARRAVDSRALLQWAAIAPVEIPQGLRLAAVASSVAVGIALAGWALGFWEAAPFQLATIAVMVCTWKGRAFSHRVLDGIGRPIHDLQTLTELFDRLDVERFEAPRLAQLHAALSADGHSPSGPIARLGRWLEIHESKGNVFFAVLAFFLVWDLQLAVAVEGWRRRFGTRVAVWIDSLGEIEALISIGTYAFENPADPNPAFEESGPCFHAEGIAHPLLPQGRAIRNDLSLDRERQMLVITGSNMSGKSTLLRTVGINTVLALAGAPVRAVSLRFRPSRWAHRSAFRTPSRTASRASTRRSSASARSSTSRRERRRCSSSSTRSSTAPTPRSAASARRRWCGPCWSGGAIGLVTSHDLALAEIAVSLAPRAPTFISKTISKGIAWPSTTRSSPDRCSGETPWA